MSADSIRVRVVYALAEEQVQMELRVPASATVGEAAEKSGLLDRFEPRRASELQCAVFGRLVALNEPLRDGDRVEILRPLLVDPKQSRRQAAANGRKR